MTIQDFLDQNPNATREELATIINNTMVTVRKPYYINARTLYGVNQAAAKAILDSLKESDIHLYAIMMSVGNNDGSSGGVDVSLDSTRAFIDSLNNGPVGETIKARAEETVAWPFVNGYNRLLDFNDIPVAIP